MTEDDKPLWETDPVAYMMLGDLDKPFHRPECRCQDCEYWRKMKKRPTYEELTKEQFRQDYLKGAG